MPALTAPSTPDLTHATANALAILRRNVESFGTKYPEDVTVDDVYPLRRAQYGQPEGGNTEWTTGFVPGMLWLAGDLTADAAWYEAARAHLPSFLHRIHEGVDVETHDLGFLYSLSCVPAWQRDHDEAARGAAILAADHLVGRVLEPAGIIQSWGNLEDPTQRGRAIIDSLMNMPLLYWATETTGDPRYAAAAHRHAGQLSNSMIRDDDTTHHTFYWDVETGAPSHGATAQGHADDSTWARGQAWGIYGFTLNHLHTGDPRLLAAAKRCAGRFLSLLPLDHVPFWDMVFTDGSEQERDSSAGAIAVCGLIELAGATGNPEYQTAADAILASLVTHYAADADDEGSCLLRHGVYDKKAGKGVDEGNLWGDYYYLEALLRLQRPQWNSPWAPTAI